MSDIVTKDQDKVPDPGLEPHVERYTDANESEARRANRLIVALFGVVSPLMAVLFIVTYFAVPMGTSVNIIFATVELQHLLLGLTAGIALLSIGIGLEHWAKQLMNDHEVVEERHPAASSDEDRATFLGKVDDGVKDTGLSRRTMVLSSLVGGTSILVAPVIVTLADLGPWPTASKRRDTIETTIWAKDMRIVTAETHRYIKPDDMSVGQLINAEPEALKDLHGTAHHQENSKSPVILVKIDPKDLDPKVRADWHVDGVLCYSKICTHVGCPVSLYEQDTHNLLCPCHQSTFDLADSGLVVFGPAARALPQLPITVDDEGYLVAQRGFDVPVGPSYWERDSSKDFKKGES